MKSEDGAFDVEREDEEIHGFCDNDEIAENDGEIAEEVDIAADENIPARLKVKGKKDCCNYLKNPLEEFVEWADETSKSPHPIVFEQAAVGRASAKSFKDMEPEEILDKLWMPSMELIVRMYNLANALKKPLSIGKLKAYYGITMYTYAWKHADIRAYWGGDTYAGQPKPDFSKIMPRSHFMEIKRNFRFEDYAKPSSSPETDAMWKMRSFVELFKKTLMDSIPAPYQHISVDEAMIKYTAYRCPIIRAMPNKPIPRGLKLYVAVDNETGVPFNFNVCDDMFNEKNCRDFEGGQPGKQVIRLLEHLPGEGYIVYTDNWYTSIGLARQLKRMEQKIGLIGTVRKERVPDAIKLVRLGAVNAKTGRMPKSKKPTLGTPKGTLRSACTTDGEVHVYGIMDTAAVYFVDSVYGGGDTAAIVSRRERLSLSS